MYGSKKNMGGFTIVELLIACVIFPIIVFGVSDAYENLQHSYTIARQLNEIYAVISACPEVDRALEFDSVSSSANCYPNNSFIAEGGGKVATITYTPTLTVTSTSALANTDPLYNIFDSKVIDISVGYPKDSSSPPVKLKLLITRNGIGQQ
jgi:Tfp pilus assembly protein PilV